MQPAVNIIIAVLLFAAMAVPSRHALHMFQQNRYEIGRYSSWIRENIKTSIKDGRADIIIGVICAVISIFLSSDGAETAVVILLAIYVVYLFRKEKKKQYIKPLVYTARVKRQTAVLVMLEAMLIVLMIKADWKFIFLFAASLLPWMLIYPVGWITMPIEKAIQKRYLNDAKRILNEHDELVRIGITGSYGKTTTKNIMQAMIGEAYNSLMTPASFNTPMGITRTIRESLKPIHQVFICEMGADHVGDITELMDFVRPSIGVVTSIGPQHLNTFGSQENIIHEKMQMIEKLPAAGLGILNYDNEFIRSYKIKNKVKTVTCGIQNPDVDYRAINIQYSSRGSSFTILHGKEEIQMETKLLGELNILNILFAAAAARSLNVDWKTIQKACRTMKPVEHRLEPKRINGYRFIDDAFNANPAGSEMALNVLSMMPPRRIIVTPGMIDLGPRQDKINHHFGTLMKDKADIVILVGKQQTKPIEEGLRDTGFDMNNVLTVDTEREAFAYIWQTAETTDTILLENDLPDAFNH